MLKAGAPLLVYLYYRFDNRPSWFRSRDRFGTPLEQRFTRSEIEAMMRRTGLVDVEFLEGEPYWCAVGRKK